MHHITLSILHLTTLVALGVGLASCSDGEIGDSASTDTAFGIGEDGGVGDGDSSQTDDTAGMASMDTTVELDMPDTVTEPDTAADTTPESDTGMMGDTTIEPDTMAETDTAEDPNRPMEGEDRDGDGLDDAWEFRAGDPEMLDWTKADTDGDGILDGDEDPDGDRLNNRDEHAFWVALGDPAPDPLQFTLLVELDAMVGRTVPDDVLDMVVEAYAVLDLTVGEGRPGIDLHMYWDQRDVPSMVLDGSFEQRHALLSNNGPEFNGIDTDALALEQMIHVMIVSQRADDLFRGGEVVTDGGNDPNKTGVLVFLDTLIELHPNCGGGIDDREDITLNRALANTLVHELGHTLQLGHDTMEGGDINAYNIMSIPNSCLTAQQRAYGVDNDDPILGNTEAVAAPRFSRDAIELMQLDTILSVDVARLDNEGLGREM